MIINLKEFPISEENYDSIIKLYNLLSKVDKTLFTYENMIEYFHSLHPSHNIYAYIMNNKIVGLITLLIEPKIIHNGKFVGHIEDLVVDADYRKMSVASKLIDYVIVISKLNNCYKVILDCVPELESFYNKNGLSYKGIYMARYF